MDSGRGHGSDGQRAVPPEETLERVQPLSKAAGVTRVADITDLDRIGIPVWSAIRPSAMSGAISVYNGKGLTREEAKVSAIMEAVERFSAEYRGDRLTRQYTGDVLTSGQDAVDPRDLILPMQSAMQLETVPVAWVKARELNTSSEVWTPASAVFHPYVPNGDLALFRTSTNGLAAGNNYDEAILHGLCEAIERDAWSLAEVRRRVNGSVVISGECLASGIMEKFTSKGVEVHLKDITSDLGIPTIAAAADDVVMQDPALLTLGIGTHPDPKVAAVKALLEVAQSRLTQIHGAREDVVKSESARKLGYERMKRLNRMWLEDGDERPLDSLEDASTGSVAGDLKAIRARLNSKGLSQVVVADLARKELDIPVVRVIVPGLEVYAIDEDRVGVRAMRAR